jgi:hypothetical protein
MLRTILTTSFAIVAAGHLYGQVSYEFEVATIKPAPPPGVITASGECGDAAISLNSTEPLCWP